MFHGNPSGFMPSLKSLNGGPLTPPRRGNNQTPMLKKLQRKSSTIFHFVDGKRIEGAPPDVCGNLSGVSGDLSGVRGNLSGVSGDLTDVSGSLSGVSGNL